MDCHGMPWSKNVKNTMSTMAGRGYTKSLEECDQSNAVLELVALAENVAMGWLRLARDKTKFQPTFYKYMTL